ncbi:MAG: ribosome-binding factor A [Patescibacteria group bacterium]
MSKRTERINSVLQRETGKIICEELELPYDTLVTITGVNTTGNLLESEILFTVFPQSKEEEVLQGLRRNVYDIQKILNRKLRMKPVPKIRFKIDEGMKNFYRIDEISPKKMRPHGNP